MSDAKLYAARITDIMAIDRSTPLGRVQHAIMIEKKLRQQQKARNEDTTDVTERINELRKQARDLIQQMESTS